LLDNRPFVQVGVISAAYSIRAMHTTQYETVSYAPASDDLRQFDESAEKETVVLSQNLIRAR
jgi:hypothetical protein